MNEVQSNKDFSVKEAFVFGFKGLWDNILYFLGISVLYALLSTIVMTAAAIAIGASNWSAIKQLGQSMKEAPKEQQLAITMAWISHHFLFVILLFIWLFIVFFFVGRYFLLGLTNMAFHVYDRKPISMGTFFSTYRLLLKDFGAAFLYWVIVSIGFVLLIIPGVYFMLALSLYHQFIVDKSSWPIEALKQSFELTKGIKWKLLAVSLINWCFTLVINLFSIIPGVGILMIFIPPLVSLVYVYIYRILLQLEESGAQSL